MVRIPVESEENRVVRQGCRIKIAMLSSLGKIVFV
jgi:hypothetical protein